MNEIADWVQNHWYELGTLLVQAAFLIAAVWFAHKILKSMRASQEQVGALIRLSVSDGLNKSGQPGHWPAPYVAAEWPAQQGASVLTLPTAAPRTRHLAAAWRATVEWLQTPMGGHGMRPWRKVMRWLQAPAGT